MRRSEASSDEPGDTSGETAKVEAALDPDAPRYFNREVSWLQFNRRVLAEAANPAYPLLERLRFLAISGTNLDEFFMVRVAGLRGQQIQNIEDPSIDGLSPSQQLPRITAEADALVAEQQALWHELRPQLAQVGVEVLELHDIERSIEPELTAFFREQLFPVITPQALDPSHPFPFIPNLGLSMLFDLRRRSDGETVRELIMLPAAIPRFLVLAGSGTRCIRLETVLRHFCGKLFPGYEILGSAALRVIRDSDIELEEEAEDLVRYFRSAIKRRRRGRVIRLEAESAIPPELAALLARELGNEAALVTTSEGILGIADLAQLVEFDRPELKFPPYTPRFPERIREHDGDCFAAIREKDIVVHHPYEAFDVVLAFLRQAALDPEVLAIKQTLYRAGKQGAVVARAVRRGRGGQGGHRRRGTEGAVRRGAEPPVGGAARAVGRAGRLWLHRTEDPRQDQPGGAARRQAIRSYCHFGTGNYHPVTARTYTDLSYFTADPIAARDAAEVFNYITGYLEPRGLQRLAVSPAGLREKLFALLDREIANAKEGKPSGVWAKMNALSDRRTIDKLYEAGAAGVPIELVVRGVCCLRPQVPGLSETIRVKSIIGRFLEHSRVWAFANGAKMPSRRNEVFISSADWMSRNFDRRVELALPLRTATIHDQVLGQVMLANLLDTEQSWALRPDGSYARVGDGQPGFNLHRYFMTNPSLSGRGAALDGTRRVPKLRLKR